MKPTETQSFHPDGFHFDFGSWDEHDFLEWKDGALYYRAHTPHLTETKLAIPTERWRRFWDAADRIGIWTWQPEYVNSEVLDGIQWELELRYSGRVVQCIGSNAYPGADDIQYARSGPFGRFLRALRDLTGISTIE